MGDDVVQLAGDALPFVQHGLPSGRRLLLLELRACSSAERARATGRRSSTPATQAIVMKLMTETA